MTEPQTTKRRCPPERIARTWAVAIASALLGCGMPLMPDFRSEEPAPEPAQTAAAQSEPNTRDASRYRAAAAYSARRGGRALVVVEGSEVVFAAGQNGHAVDEAHPLYNASLSFWGPLAIAAESDGLLDLDERVSRTIPEFEDVRWKEDMRVRHLLQYTSGLEAGFRPLIQQKPKNHFARALSLAMVAPPGERFQFGPSHLAVFGEVLRRKLESESSDPLAYLQRRLFDPIGLRIAGWERDDEGNINLSGGARIAAPEWVKFGVLMRNRGVWNGEEILEASELEACFRGSEVQPRFGLTFWLNTPGPDSEGAAGGSETVRPFYSGELPDLVVAAGIGNQRLFAIPSRNLVVARMGKRDANWRDHEFLALLVGAGS